MLKNSDESGRRRKNDAKEMGRRLLIVAIVMISTYATARLYGFLTESRQGGDTIRFVYVIQFLVLFLISGEYREVPIIRIAGVALLLGVSSTLALLVFQ